MEIAAHGFDTLRPVWEFPEGLPAADSEWKKDMLGAGFEVTTKGALDDKTGEYVSSEFWSWQDPTNSTLRLHLRGGRHLTAEFSVPRLLDDSPVNLRLASSDEAREVLEYVGNLASLQVPGATTPTLHKLSRADYACDLWAESAAPG